MSRGVTNLPVDILEKIFESLSLQDQRSFALASRGGRNAIIDFRQNLARLDINRVKKATLVDNAFIKQVLPHFPGLRALSLRGCSGITDDALTALSSLGKLESLDLSYCSQISGEGLRYLPRLLRSLNLEVCHGIMDDVAFVQDRNHLEVPHIGLSHLSNLERLEALNLRFLHLDDQELVHIPKSVTYLSLSGRITGFGNLGHLENLDFLDVRSCKSLVAGSLAGIPRTVRDLNLSQSCRVGDDELRGLPEGLVRLNLRDCQVSDLGLVHLSGMDNLQVLDLGYLLHLKGEGFKHLPNSLLELDLGHSEQVEDKYLGDLPDSLRRLNFTFCRITDEGLKLLNLPHIEYLQLHPCMGVGQGGKRQAAWDDGVAFLRRLQGEEVELGQDQEKIVDDGLRLEGMRLNSEANKEGVVSRESGFQKDLSEIKEIGRNLSGEVDELSNSGSEIEGSEEGVVKSSPAGGRGR